MTNTGKRSIYLRTVLGKKLHVGAVPLLSDVLIIVLDWLINFLKAFFCWWRYSWTIPLFIMALITFTCTVTFFFFFQNSNKSAWKLFIWTNCPSLRVILFQFLQNGVIYHILPPSPRTETEKSHKSSMLGVVLILTRTSTNRMYLKKTCF